MRKGEGLRAIGKEFRAKSIPSMVGFIDYLCLGAGHMIFFQQGDWAQLAFSLPSEACSTLR